MQWQCRSISSCSNKTWLFAICNFLSKLVYVDGEASKNWVSASSAKKSNQSCTLGRYLYWKSQILPAKQIYRYLLIPKFVKQLSTETLNIVWNIFALFYLWNKKTLNFSINCYKSILYTNYYLPIKVCDAENKSLQFVL